MRRRWYSAIFGAARTLQLRRPFGHTLVLAAIFMFIFFVAGELLIRFAASHIVLGTPSLGSEHRQFEQQWFRLKNYAAQHRSIDCIFIGDSTVITDFSPATFAESFRDQTGEHIECYNFGVGAFSVVGLASLARILAQEYSPRLLFVGVEALNFTVPREAQGSADLSSTAWAQYKLGGFTVEGWLFEHTYFYRYLGIIGHLVASRINYNEVIREAQEANGMQDGFYPMDGPGPFDVAKPPNPAVKHSYIEHYYAALKAFRLLPENVEALEKILALNSTTTQIIIVEMPVPYTFHTFFGKGTQDYKTFVEAITQKTRAQNVPLWRMENLELLPGPMWYNYNHLNADGAPIFSSWLGKKLGQSLDANDP